jgi:hypothetical protein
MHQHLAPLHIILIKDVALILPKKNITQKHNIFCKEVRKRVVVYNTYAGKGRLHFDVFIPTDKSQPTQVPKEIDDETVEYAKEFLSLIGKPSSGDDDISVNMCERCHIDNTDLYADELWKLPGKEVFIWPMEGYPRPPSSSSS